ncbi:Homeobox protein knotted-1-like 6 [Glycine soja]|nr:Homeobox protein knotted-1-like 6 [Glycine soja]
MDGMYGVPAEYADKALMTPENLIFPPDYHHDFLAAGRIPLFGSDEFFSSSAGIHRQQEDDVSHQSQNRLSPSLPSPPPSLHRVGAPPEIARLLEEIRRENDPCKSDAEAYCDMLVKYKSDLARPFDEATTFLNKIEMQLSHLCTGASVSNVSGLFFSLPLSLQCLTSCKLLLTASAINYNFGTRCSFVDICAAFYKEKKKTIRF